MTDAAKRNIDPHLVSLLNRGSREAEHYRKLRHNIEVAKQSDKGYVVAVTSAMAGDGKTLTSINLAGALAQNTGAKVLLVELDLRRQFTNVKDYLGYSDDKKPGLVDKSLEPAMPWKECTRYLEEYNLHIMLSGKRVDSPYEVLKSDGLGVLISEARRVFDYIVLDTPPITVLPDSQLISRWVDSYLVVVAADRTPKDAVEETLDQMTPEKTLGIVFNQYSPSKKRYKAYY